MVSIAPCSDMETETCREEDEGPSLEPSEPQVNQTIGGSVYTDNCKEVTPGSSDEDKGLQEKEQPGTVGSEGTEQWTQLKTVSDPDTEVGETQREGHKKLKKTNSWKMVRFQDPSEDKDTLERDSSAESLFPEYPLQQWSRFTFEELFAAEDWQDITEDQLLRKKVLEPVEPHVQHPTWGQEVTVKMQGVLEDHTVVEKDWKLVFVVGEGDVTQALEECVLSMQQGEITLLLADSQYAYGLLGREPDVPAWSPLLYQLQLLDVRDKPDRSTLSVADRIRLGSRKRERGNFHFQREDYVSAARAYGQALEVLTTAVSGGGGGVEENAEVQQEEEEKVELMEVQESRVKCLNNLAAAHIKLEQLDQALQASLDVLTLSPHNVKALYRAGKLLSDQGEYKEAMEMLRKALKLEPSTKVIHLELSKLVRRQTGSQDSDTPKPRSAELLKENTSSSLVPPQKNPTGTSWKFVLGALVVALGSLATSVFLSIRQ